MEPTDLHALWSAPDNSRLTAKQSSFRLPVHVAAKLAALCELYPSKTRTQIVGDLLATAIEASVGGLRSVKGPELQRVDIPGEGQCVIYQEVGPLGTYKHLANQHFAALERELGNDSPGLVYPHDYTSEEPGSEVACFAVQEGVRE